MSLIQRHGLWFRIDWTRVATRYLPFADAASPDLPLPRLARLSLFQVSVGMATALMVGTLNRVMIVELGVGAWLVALMVALPLLVAPLRALIGFRSDTHKSFLGWKRVPFIWLGTMLQFGGLAIMPFALILLTGETPLQLWAGHIAAAVAFLLAGAGLQTAQTAGLALATDLASEQSRPRVVALMYVMLLVGMVGAAAVFGVALAEYTHTRLVQVVQGAAVATVFLNGIALWKQEPRSARKVRGAAAEGADFRSTWARFAGQPRTKRFLVAVGLGTAAFSMQDIILEPYGGEVLHLAVGATTMLTALMAGGAIAAFALAARLLARGADPYRVAAGGAVAGLAAFSAVIFAAPLDSALLFRAGALMIGFGGGLFSVGTLTAAMGLDAPSADGRNHHGLVLGAWGAVQACCAGAAIALGGFLRDAVNGLGHAGALGEALAGPGAGYGVVYHLELLLLFATLIAVGPLVRKASSSPRTASPEKFGLADLPG
jgi:BCD family chlorophyll transporter-like MFS transporter